MHAALNHSSVVPTRAIYIQDPAIHTALSMTCKHKFSNLVNFVSYSYTHVHNALTHMFTSTLTLVSTGCPAG